MLRKLVFAALLLIGAAALVQAADVDVDVYRSEDCSCCGKWAKYLEKNGGDEKILAVPVPRLTRRYEHVHNFTDLPQIALEQVQHFFAHYKDLEPGKWVRTHGWGDADEAKRLIRAAIDRAQRMKAAP